MQAPLGNIVRKILTDEDASKKLMQQMILGERFGGKEEFINLDDKKIKIHRVVSFDGNTNKNGKK
jgi:hypothetical protein